jgi:hypothetical protein
MNLVIVFGLGLERHLILGSNCKTYDSQKCLTTDVINSIITLCLTAQRCNMEYGVDFDIGDKVTFGLRFCGSGRIRGGIARRTGVVIAYEQYTHKRDLTIVRYNDKLYNLRELKGGWVVETERDDPKGRLYMRKAAK